MSERGKITYEKFKNTVFLYIKEFLPDDYKDANVSMKKLKTNNQETDVLFIDNHKHSIYNPVIVINEFFTMYENGTSIDKIIKQMISLHIAKEKEINNMYDERLYDDFNLAKDKIIYVTNQFDDETIYNLPHIFKCNDIVITFKIIVNIVDDIYHTLVINNVMLNNWKVDVEELLKVALVNTPIYYPPKIITLNSLLKNDKIAICNEFSGEEKYLLTNFTVKDGTSTMFYLKLLDEWASSLRKDIIVIPCTRNACIVFPENKEYEKQPKSYISTCLQTIQTIKDFRSFGLEVLSNSIYKYDLKEKDIINLWEVK